MPAEPGRSEIRHGRVWDPPQIFSLNSPLFKNWDKAAGLLQEIFQVRVDNFWAAGVVHRGSMRTVFDSVKPPKNCQKSLTESLNVSIHQHLEYPSSAKEFLFLRENNESFDATNTNHGPSIKAISGG